MLLEETRVYVIDASSLFNAKRYIQAKHQWGFFNETMTKLVERRELLITPQVENECERAKHPDVPGAWALAIADHFPGVRDPDMNTVKEVLRGHPKSIDPDGEKEQADPYVVARAVELQNAGEDVCVVTDDVKNRLPAKSSIADACAGFGVDWIMLAAFLGPDHLDVSRNRLTHAGRQASGR